MPRIILKSDILAVNSKSAAKNRQRFASAGITVLNLMGSPGAGKTTLLEKTLVRLRPYLRLAVIEGDLFTDADARRIEALGVQVVQINTQGTCHLDAALVEAGFRNLDAAGLDLLVVENVGNLVCPVEFDLGENLRAVVFSLPEGNDKPLKYPGAFAAAGAVVLAKTDLLPVLDFDVVQFQNDLKSIAPHAALFPVSARTGEGMEAWCSWLFARCRETKEGAMELAAKPGGGRECV